MSHYPGANELIVRRMISLLLAVSWLDDEKEGVRCGETLHRKQNNGTVLYLPYSTNVLYQDEHSDLNSVPFPTSINSRLGLHAVQPRVMHVSLIRDGKRKRDRGIHFLPCPP